MNEDGLEIFQIYPKEISKRMLEAMKGRVNGSGDVAESEETVEKLRRGVIRICFVILLSDLVFILEHFFLNFASQID